MTFQISLEKVNCRRRRRHRHLFILYGEKCLLDSDIHRNDIISYSSFLLGALSMLA